MRKKTASVCIGLCAGIVIKLFMFDVLYISGQSMEPGLQSGEFVFLNKLSYGLVKPFSNEFLIQWSSPKQDDVVIFLMNDRHVIKRCAAVAGTPLEFSADSGYSVTVGEKKIPLKETQYQRLKNAEKVPQGTVFAVGDNYAESIDSRDYGFVSVTNITGKALYK